MPVKWVGDTSKIETTGDGTLMQKFNSWFVYEELGGPDRFSGVQFHFHHKSEHTIDGKWHDLEMHTVHLPDDGPRNGVKYAAMGIMFSVNEHNAKVTEDEQMIIDNFFESLKWTETEADPTVDLVTYGDLMMMVDTDNRWVYKGSVTTPPCDTYVYWNVVRKIYPLKQKYLDQFKEQLKRGGMETTGNNREIQKYNGHNLHIISSRPQTPPGVILPLIVVLGVSVLILCLCVGRMYRQLRAFSVTRVNHSEMQAMKENAA